MINLVGAFLLVPRQSLADALGHKASVASMPSWRGWRRRSPPWAVRWVQAWKPTRRYARRRMAIRPTRNSPADRTFGGHSRRTRLTGDRCEDQQKRVGDQTRHEPAK